MCVCIEWASAAIFAAVCLVFKEQAGVLGCTGFSFAPSPLTPEPSNPPPDHLHWQPQTKPRVRTKNPSTA